MTGHVTIPRLLAAVAVISALALVGCEGNGIKRDDNAPKEAVDGRFLCDNRFSSFDTVVDSRTGVTYLVWRLGTGTASVGGITVLLNRDGTPVISEEDTL